MCLKQREHWLKGGVSFSVQLFSEEAESSHWFVGNISAAETELLSFQLSSPAANSREILMSVVLFKPQFVFFLFFTV